MLNQVKNPIRYKINSWHNDQHLVNLRVNQQFFNIIKIFKVWVQLSGPHLDFEIVDFRVDHFFTIFCANAPLYKPNPCFFPFQTNLQYFKYQFFFIGHGNSWVWSP